MIFFNSIQKILGGTGFEAVDKYVEKSYHADTAWPFLYHAASDVSGAVLVAERSHGRGRLGVHSGIFLRDGWLRNGGLQGISGCDEAGKEKRQREKAGFL